MKEEKLANIVSGVFHPMLMPTFALLLIFSLKSYVAYAIPFQGKLWLLAMVFTTTFLIPAVFILLLYRREIITSKQLVKKEERVFPLIISIVFYYLAFHMIRQLHMHEVYQRMLLGTTLIVILFLPISIFWKISAHMSGVGGFLGGLIGISMMLSVDVFVIAVITVLAAGLVGFARLKLEVHTPAQVYAGFALSFFVMLAVFLV